MRNSLAHIISISGARNAMHAGRQAGRQSRSRRINYAVLHKGNYNQTSPVELRMESLCVCLCVHEFVCK